MVEMEVQTRWCAPDSAVADADVENRVWPDVESIPKSGIFQQWPRPGRDRIGPSVESRILHRRQWGLVDQCDGYTRPGQTAGKRPANRASAHDANLYRKRIRHVNPVAWA
jgi:hypothetical protein